MNNTKLIAKFIGYKYYFRSVSIDASDCGGIYTSCEVFSKVPILIDTYKYDDYEEHFFSDDWHKLGINCNNYFLKPFDDRYNDISFKDYNESWDELIPVIKKISESVGEDLFLFKSFQTIRSSYSDFNREECCSNVIKFIELYNEIKSD